MTFNSHIVSEGTLRNEDLIPAFISEAYSIIENYYDGSEEDIISVKQFLEQAEKDFEENEENGVDIVEELHNLLNEISPKGFIFGTSEGDGACFGFWEY